jgi:hypothetical protein
MPAHHTGVWIALVVLTIFWTLYVNPGTKKFALKLFWGVPKLFWGGFKLVVLVGLVLLVGTSPITEEMIGFTPIGLLFGQPTDFWRNIYVKGTKYNELHHKLATKNTKESKHGRHARKTDAK